MTGAFAGIPRRERSSPFDSALTGSGKPLPRTRTFSSETPAAITASASLPEATGDVGSLGKPRGLLAAAGQGGGGAGGQHGTPRGGRGGAHRGVRRKEGEDGVVAAVVALLACPPAASRVC